MSSVPEPLSTPPDLDEVEWEDTSTGPLAPARPAQRPWKILVVDDDESVLQITALVLANLTFRGRPVELVERRSGEAALQALRADPEIALVLLDVVMESTDAGLRTVKAIREEMQNAAVRIVLRTGQPGSAPERDVVMLYEIDGYELKTGLTSQSLLTVVVSALRAYDLIRTMERSRQGLELIVNATAELSQRRSLRTFASGVLTQLQAMIGQCCDGLFCAHAPRAHSEADPGWEVLAGSGRYANWTGQRLDEADPSGSFGRLLAVQPDAAFSSADRGSVIALHTPMRKGAVIWIDSVLELEPIHRQLVEVFCAKISVAFTNVHLLEQLRKSQQATVVALADLAEFRDTDTGEHVLRVARMTDLIARDLWRRGVFHAELDELLVEQIGLASMLHDVGKVSIPDVVLLKPMGLNPTERAQMETHAAVGARILNRADQMVGDQTYITVATDIAASHHEHYDGAGYPRGLRGVEIPLSARITAVADVFDALSHDRPYKKAWPRSEARDYIVARSGSQFDPEVVTSFVRVLDVVAARGTDLANIFDDPLLV
jgi:response regulator RpfG family c-di-GMP phosphodiesterase